MLTGERVTSSIAVVNADGKRTAERRTDNNFKRYQGTRDRDDEVEMSDEQEHLKSRCKVRNTKL